MVHLAFDVQAQHCTLSDADEERMKEDVSKLQEVVDCFPTSALHVRVNRHDRHNDYHVKTSLHLPKRTLFTGDRHVDIHAAYHRCLRKLIHKVKAYKDRMDNRHLYEKPDWSKEPDVAPPLEPDALEIRAALEERDFAKFRRALDVYEKPLELEVSRHLQQFPEAASQLTLHDVVEETFLSAFERFQPVMGEGQSETGQLETAEFSSRLEHLVESSIQSLLEQGYGVGGGED